MNRNQVAVGAALLTGLFTLLQLGLVLLNTQGTFVYALDDPYIHLDLARQFALTGIYGVNPGEYAAPSSSILWPFLLAPFAYTPFFIYVPFIIGWLSAMAGGFIVARLLPETLSASKRVALAFLATLALNLPGLALIGMEHGLHIAVTLLLAGAILRVLNGEAPPRWIWALIMIEPLIRYEGVLVSAAALGILFWLGYRRQAVLTGVLMSVPIVAFSYFLYSHHLGILPGSTMVKKLHLGDAYVGFWSMWVRSVLVGLVSPSGFVFIAGTIAAPFYLLFILKEWRTPRFAVALAVAGLLTSHMLLGRMSSFESPRYDLYVVAFVLPLGFWLLHKYATRMPFRITLIPLLINLAIPGMYCSLWDVRNAANTIYQQQYQMQRLVQHYWHDSIAVNDIGLVGLGTQAYVLDLVGLANPEVLHNRQQRVPDWANQLIRREHIPLIIVYRSWFDKDVRASWTPLGELFRSAHTSLGDDSVLLLTPYSAEADHIRAILHDWAQGLPEGSRYMQYDTAHPAPD